MSELAFPTDATGLEIAAVNRADCNTEFMVTEPQERGAAETHRIVIVTLRHALKIRQVIIDNPRNRDRFGVNAK